jgi:diguanylate cyclase (GGDEF)-like protein
MRINGRDELTGLPTPWRGDWKMHLEEAFPPAARPKPGDGFLLADLVGFRYVNDWWGPSHGDEVLRTVVAVITRAAVERPVWRYGGDEFLVMTTGGVAPARLMAGEIRDGIRALGDGAPGRPMDVRIGIAVAGRSDSSEDLIRRADRALVSAERGGGITTG